MRRTRPLIALLLLTLALTPFALHATAVAQSGEQVVVRYLVPQWASSRDTRIERQIAFQSVIDSFHLRYPQYRLEQVVGPGSQVSIAQALADGDADAVWINHAWYADWQAAGFFADLTDYLSDGAEEAFFDWTIEALRSVDGRLGGLWHNTDTPLYFFDTTYIAEAPTTWSELRAVAEQVFVDTGKYAISYPIRNWAQYNMGMFAALGGEIFDADGRPVLFEGANRDALEQIFDHYATIYGLGFAPASSAAANHDQQMPPVYAGDVVAMVSNNNAVLRYLRPNLPPGEVENWSAAPLPYPDGADAGRFVAGGWVIALAANAADPAKEAAAAAWIEHMTDVNAQRDTNKAGGWVPTRPGVIEADPFYADDPFMVTTVAALNAGGWVVPFNPLYPAVVTSLNEAIAQVVTGQQTVAQALAEAETAVMREFEAAR
jgi:multiple sugar transport system substrate-binding protein